MLKIILADNQAIFRAGAAKVLGVEDDLRIVAQADSADKAAMALEKFHAGVVIFSPGLFPDLKAVAEQVRKHRARAVVIADSGDNASHFLAAGMQGVIFRNVSGPALVECVRQVAKGETWVQGPSATTPEDRENDLVGARVRDRLTPKELKIVALIVQGYKNKEIAARLGTTEQVIKNYLRNVYDKIGVSDRLELALFTIHHRILAEAAAAVSSTLAQP